MKKSVLILVIILVLPGGCEWIADNNTKGVEAMVVDFDLNCSTCILHLDGDSDAIHEFPGESRGNYFNAVNLPVSDFMKGQKLKITRFREANAEEVPACKTMFPTYSYPYIYILDYFNLNEFSVDDTVFVKMNECVYDPDNNLSICLDTVYNDSRCPKGVVCVWEGFALARFRINHNNGGDIHIDLGTHRNFQKDTLLEGYRISFINLMPYPEYNKTTPYEDYLAQLHISKEK